MGEDFRADEAFAVEIGKKIRRARLEANMSQKEFSDGIVTRNMLSLIENGNAVPSLYTLNSLAARLGLSAGYFFSDDSSRDETKKSAVISDIRQKFSRGDYNSCIEKCAFIAGNEDDEINFILSVCFYRSALNCYSEGRFSAALNTFNEAVRRGKKTCYPSMIESLSQAYISSVESFFADSDSFIPLPTEEYTGDVTLYSVIVSLIRSQKNDAAEALMPHIVHDVIYFPILEALLSCDDAFEEKVYFSALSYQRGDTPYNLPLKYFLCTRLERICRCKYDYKGEFSYSRDRMNFFERIK